MYSTINIRTCNINKLYKIKIYLLQLHEREPIAMFNDMVLKRTLGIHLLFLRKDIKCRDGKQTPNIIL